MSPIAIQVGNFVVYKYSLCMLTAFVIGYILAIIEAKKHNITEKFVTDFLFYLVPISIIGARLYYVAFSFNDYKDSLIDIFKVWNGGLAIHGGVIFGLIFLIFYTKKHKVDTIRFMDIAAVSLVLGQAIGRWGNFFNQEAYGPATTLATLKSWHIPNFIIDNMKIGNVYYQPTFFYESMGCLLIFIILLLIRKIKKVPAGTICSIYLICYGIIRFLIEGLRQDSLMFMSLKIAQCVSIFMIISGIVLLIYSFRVQIKQLFIIVKNKFHSKKVIK